MTENVSNLWALSTSCTVANSIYWNVNLFSILADSGQTNGRYSLVHTWFRKGGGPPPHVHTMEEEDFFILEGEILFQIGKEKILGKAGDYIKQPRNISHTFSVITETAKALMLITPGGFEEFFRKFGTPAVDMQLPSPNWRPPYPDYFAEMEAYTKMMGVTMLPEF